MTNPDESSLYIFLLSIHGLVRGNSLELGRDADTGGQVKYAVELARKLSVQPCVSRVDLVTRQIFDTKVDRIYSQSEEQIAEKAFIIRLPSGPKRYLRKEVLWNYLDGFSDQAIQYIRRAGKVPDVIHGHYADAGYVGAQIARLLGVPFIYTGHSLGRVKRERLLEKGMNEPKLEGRYNISKRIDAEEFALDTAAMVVASTRQEISDQYSAYENYDPKRMIVIPPGVDLEKFFPPKRGFKKSNIEQELDRFLIDPKKPMILAISRADQRKNIESLIHAFAQNIYLREHCNLVIFAGNRDDINKMDSGVKKVLTNILFLVDKYNLHGKAAYPKNHKPEEVPEIYRLAAKSKGVFVNPALTEPFGLTLLEAAASGLPLVSTNDGGPITILENCQNGLLVNPLDTAAMGTAIQSILEDKNKWLQFSKNGIKNTKKHYSWMSHSKLYIKNIKRIINLKHYKKNIMVGSGKKLTKINKLIIADIDNTLLGDNEGLFKLIERIDEAGEHVGLGVATGRRLTSAIDVLNKNGVPNPDLLITSVGSEIYYGKGLVHDRTWHNHLAYKWQPDLVREVMQKIPGLVLQPEIDQRKYKISYNIDPETTPAKRKIIGYLRKQNLQVKVIHSHNAYLDILPIRASKGLAVRYLAMKWGMTPEQIIVAGDSGNDEEMLRGNTLGVVVGNYSSELKHLYGKPRIYFAEQEYANGILEGIEYYNFI